MTGQLKIYERRLNEIADRTAEQFVGPPIDLNQLCESFGVQVRGVDRVPADRFKASLSFQDGLLDRPTVCVSSDVYGSAYARVCVAHEIAHLILIREYGAVPTGRAEYWQYETICDEFARRVLVPQHYVDRLIRERSLAHGRVLMRSIDIEQGAQVTWIHGARRLADALSDVAFLRIEQRADDAFFVAATTLPSGRSTRISADNSLARRFREMLETARLTGRARLTEIGRELFSQGGQRLRLPETYEKVFAICRRRDRTANSEILLVAI